MQQKEGAESLPDISSVRLDCEAAVAADSPDHLAPWGTKRDNSVNPRFNFKAFRVFAGLGRPVKVLDLGCSGGGFVKSCVDDGCLAVGLEGSDYSRKHKRAEWLTIPEHLFTCDISKRFRLFWAEDAASALKFDLITAWEVVEHLPEDRLGQFMDNIKAHLSEGGLCVASVSPKEEVVNGVRLHLSVHPKEWWLEKFASKGLVHLEEFVGYFNTQFVRGEKFGAPGSFHVILTSSPDKAPAVPRERLVSRILDIWYGSNAQRQLRKLVTGE